MTVLAGKNSVAVVQAILESSIACNQLVELISVGTDIEDVGLNLKTGEIIKAKFTDKGPDMELRLARILGGGATELMNIYSSFTQELVVGPFNYSPIRAVDIWLQLPDDLLVQSLLPGEKESKAEMIRGALKVRGDHPYPGVTLFRQNMGRCYRRDFYSGEWNLCQPSSQQNFYSCGAEIGQLWSTQGREQLY